MTIRQKYKTYLGWIKHQQTIRTPHFQIKAQQSNANNNNQNKSMDLWTNKKKLK